MHKDIIYHTSSDVAVIAVGILPALCSSVVLELSYFKQNSVKDMDRALQKCYEHDIDWTLLPEKLLWVRVCISNFLIKVLIIYHTHEPKMQWSLNYALLLLIFKVCSLFGILSLISFSMGHGAVDVGQF